MRIILLLSFLLGLMIPVCFAQGAMDLSRSPNSARECATCHYEWMDVFMNEKRGTMIAPLPAAKEVASERMCFSCHDGSMGDSRLLLWSAGAIGHKVDVALKPEMNPPATLPLDKNGRMNCMTCHTAHGTPDSISQTVQTSVFLRMSNDNSELCVSCHNQMTGSKSHPLTQMTPEMLKTFRAGDVKLTADNKISCDSCHRVHGAKDNMLLRVSPSANLCYTCHSGVFKKNDPTIAHVVNGGRVNDRVKNVVEGLQKAVLGERGELVCFSCHSIHNAQSAGLLLKNNDESAFCRACHGDGYDDVFKSSHNMITLPEFKTASGQTAAEVGPCSACHGSHEWNHRLPAGNVATITAMCVSCHTAGGVAHKKPIDIRKYNHYMGDVAADRARILQNIELSKLPDATQRFLNRFFGEHRSKNMATRSTVTCVTCHDVHAANGEGKMFLRSEISNGQLCIDCHAQQGTIEQTPHGGAKINGSCIGCHQVHNATSVGLVRDGGCVSCHNAKAITTEHPLMKGLMPAELALHGFNHPVDAATKTVFPAPMKPNTEGKITCSSCHNPHAAQDTNAPMKRNFLRTSDNVNNFEQFCVTCHTGKNGLTGTWHSPDPNVRTVANVRTNRQSESCDMCHKVHNAPVQKNIFSISGTYKTASDFCTVCHNSEGDAKNRVIDDSKGHVVGKLENRPTTDVKFLTRDGNNYRIECSNCHDPHTNGGQRGSKTSTFSTAFIRNLDANQPNVCLACHTSQSGMVGGGHDVSKFPNQTAETKQRVESGDLCGTCHTIHDSNRNTFLMVGSTPQERCEHCHNTGGGTSTKSVKTSHPTEVTVKDNTFKLPLDEGKVVCATCHEPHSGSPAMVRPSVTKVEELCTSCHVSQKWVAVSQHNMSIARINDTALQDVAKQNSCAPCHAAHNFDEKLRFMWARGNNVGGKQDAIYNSCVDCHSKDGVSSSVPKYLRHSKLMRMFVERAVWRDRLFNARGERSADGEISCSSCHDPHIWSADPAKRMQAALNIGKDEPIKGDNTTSFLKSGVLKEFCAVCHDDAEARYDKYHEEEFRMKQENKRGIFGRSSGDR